MKQEIVHIGIDVSKEQLDIFDPVSGRNEKVPNSVQGFRAIRDMARRRKAIACFEPTGGLEHDLVLFLDRARVPMACCDAFRVRHYALSTGEFSKNDPLDARMISRFADATKPKVLEPRDLRVRELRSRWKLHKTLVGLHVLLAQKASAEHDPAVEGAQERIVRHGFERQEIDEHGEEDRRDETPEDKDPAHGFIADHKEGHVQDQ